jgi:uncharacterized protein YggE
MLSKITAFITAGLLAVFTTNAQLPQTDKPYIQVNGSAEKEVVPDEIYISINLIERYEGRNKITIDEQEKQLKEMVKNLGIDLSNLSVANADASYIRVNWFNKDVMARKGYMLKLANAEMVGQAFRELSNLNIKDASVSRVEYSKKEELKKQLRIEAVKKAKDQAEYMLAAISQTAGKPLYIAENGNFYYPMMNANRMMTMDKAQAAPATTEEDYLEFKKIKFTTTVEARFEIK